MDAFATSEEALAAEAIFEAYRVGRREDIQHCIKKHSIFTDLDNQVFASFLSSFIKLATSNLSFHRLETTL